MVYNEILYITHTHTPTPTHPHTQKTESNLQDALTRIVTNKCRRWCHNLTKSRLKLTWLSSNLVGWDKFDMCSSWGFLELVDAHIMISTGEHPQGALVKDVTCKLEYENIWRLDTNKLLETQKELTAHNWQKWKSTFLTCHCHGIHREETVGLKVPIILLKNYDFCEYLKFGAISSHQKLIFCK